MNNFRKLAFILLGFGFVMQAYSQDKPFNNVKLNVLPLLGKTFSVEYERAVNKFFSLNATVGFTPKGALPFKSTISDAVESSVIDEAKLGNLSLALEGRFYLSKSKGFMEGFYLAPFVKSAKYNVATKIDYELSETFDSETYTISGDIPVTGDINALSGGVAIGLQWIFSNRLTLDWRIMGPSYGVSSGKLTGHKDLNVLEQEEVRKQLEDLSNDLPLIKLKSEVNGQGVKATIDGPWAGIRTGLSIGYSF